MGYRTNLSSKSLKAQIPERQLLLYYSVGCGTSSLSVNFEYYTAIIRPVNGHELHKLQNVSSRG